MQPKSYRIMPFLSSFFEIVPIWLIHDPKLSAFMYLVGAILEQCQICSLAANFDQKKNNESKLSQLYLRRQSTSHCPTRDGWFNSCIGHFVFLPLQICLSATKVKSLCGQCATNVEQPWQQIFISESEWLLKIIYF